MIFTELVLQNFGAYAGQQKINLRPGENNTKPIILFGGMNGGGKTTLIDAIRLALYGQRSQCSTRGNLSYGEFLIQSVNNQTPVGEETKIELSFEHIVNGQYKCYKIIRSWNRELKNGKDILAIQEEDWFDDTLASTWDEYIENILPLGISNLFLFDGEQVKELAELETPPLSVVEAIQSLLGLELAQKLSIDLDILVSRKRKALASKQQLETIEAIEAKLSQQQTQQLQLKSNLKSSQQQLEIAQQQYQTATDNFRIEGGKIAAEKSQIDNQIKHLLQISETQRQKLRNLAYDSLPLCFITPLLTAAKQQAETEISLQKAKASQSVVEARDGKLLQYLSDLELPADKLNLIETFLQQENQKLQQQISSEKIRLGINEQELKKLDNLLEWQLPTQRSQLQQCLDQIQQLQIEIEQAERKRAIAASPEAYQSLDDAVRQSQQQLLQAQSQYHTAKKELDQLAQQIELTKQELKRYGEETIDIHNDRHIVASVAKVQQTLNLFRERLTLKKLNKLEVQITECFRYLLHKSNLVHRVAVDSGSFGLSLYDPYGKLLPKQRLSAGEKQLLAIAFLWGLARVSGRNLPIVIDTPLGRLDSSHRHNLVERYFPSASHQVILLSTDTEISQHQYQQLKDQEAIAREYLLTYHSDTRQTTVIDGYF